MESNQYLGAWHLQEILQNNGYRTLACGGFVRDFLLNKQYNDIDLATQATPQQVEDILFENNIYTIPTGAKHGTLTALVQVGEDRFEYEITTLRIDKSCDGRHAEVEFTDSFEEDAKRRDFTINALYMDLKTKEIFDFVNGQEDIKNKILRFVGNPEDRIKEDYLRLLRLIRFGAKLGFQIENNSEQAALRYRHYLEFISVERIQMELFKMLTGEFLTEIFHKYSEVILQIIPALKITDGFYSNDDEYKGNVFHHLVNTTTRLSVYKDPILSLAGLLHDIAKPVCASEENSITHEEKGAWVADKVSYKLRLSSDENNDLIFLIQNHHRIQNCQTEKDYRKLISDCWFHGKDSLEDLVKLTLADVEDSCADIIASVKSKLSILDGYRLQMEGKPLISPLTGNEIIDLLKINPGVIVGEIKDYLTEKVIEGELAPDDKERAKSIMAAYYIELTLREQLSKVIGDEDGKDN